MKPVPTPKQELAVRPDGGRFIRITPHSSDAEAWLVEEAIKFGQLFKPVVGDKKYLLIVDDGYEPGEVAEYLNSYNDAD